MISGGWECVHAALPVLRRILLRGKVRQVLNIVRGKSVFTNLGHAIRSVSLIPNSGEIMRHQIHRMLTIFDSWPTWVRVVVRVKITFILLGLYLAIARLWQ